MADEKKTKLDELREEINRTDREFLKLFEKRMDLCRAVGEYKRANGLPVLNQARENEVIKTRQSWLENPDYAESAEELFTCVMGLSRKLQHLGVYAR